MSDDELSRKAAEAERRFRAKNPDAQLPSAHEPHIRTPAAQQRKDSLRKWPKRERFAGFERDEEGFLSGFPTVEKRWAPDQFAAMAHALRWIADNVLTKVEAGEQVPAESLAMARLGYEAAFHEPLHREWAFRIASALLFVLTLPPTEHETFLSFETDMFAELGPKWPWPLLYEPPSYVTNKVLRWAFAHITPTQKGGGGRLTRLGLRDLLLRPERLAETIERDKKADRIAAREMRAWVDANRTRPPVTCIFEDEEGNPVDYPVASEETARNRLVNAIAVAADWLLFVDIFKAMALRELAQVPTEEDAGLLALASTRSHAMAWKRLHQVPLSDRWLYRCAQSTPSKPTFLMTAFLRKSHPYYNDRMEATTMAPHINAAVMGWRKTAPSQPDDASPVWKEIATIAERLGMSARAPDLIANDWNHSREACGNQGDEIDE